MIPTYTQGYNLQRKKRPLVPRLRSAVRQGHLLRSVRRFVLDHRPFPQWRLALASRHHRRSCPTFEVGGTAYPYSLSDLDSERAVEIPYAERFLADHPGRVLEVGNVLRKRFGGSQDVVDLYEAGEGIIHEDVVDYRPSAPYDTIVSVSTLEHVGFDEVVKNPDKPLQAVGNLKRMLAPGGRALVTVPLGYNPAVDRMLAEFPEQHFLKRTTVWGCWEETNRQDASGRPYEGRYPRANAVAFLIL